VERRAYRRYLTGLPVTVTHPSGFQVEARGVNIGSGGMRLIFAVDLYPVVDEEYTVEFPLPGLDKLVHNRVIVRWVDVIRTNRCGVQFLDGLRPAEMRVVVNLPSDRDTRLPY
jgi:hypothetical protein